jgi:hypothetical protein
MEFEKAKQASTQTFPETADLKRNKTIRKSD